MSGDGPRLFPCSGCGELTRSGRCGHCGVRARPGRAVALTALGLILAGCPKRAASLYGGPPTEARIDLDGDGFIAPEDCDETDARRHPDAPETPGDGVDSNCDGADDT